MTLPECRREIDLIDGELTALLCRRLAVSDEVAQVKSALGLPTRDEEREEALLSRVEALAGAENGDAVRAIYEAILLQSRARQDRKRGAGQ